MWNFGRFLNARSTKIHITVGCKNVLRVKIKVIQRQASKHFIEVDSSILHNSVRIENVYFACSKRNGLDAEMSKGLRLGAFRI